MMGSMPVERIGRLVAVPSAAMRTVVVVGAVRRCVSTRRFMPADDMKSTAVRSMTTAREP
jgi:hypothetical protein